jgi:hypothetical protein
MVDHSILHSHDLYVDLCAGMRVRFLPETIMRKTSVIFFKTTECESLHSLKDRHLPRFRLSKKKKEKRLLPGLSISMVDHAATIREKEYAVLR